MLNNTPNQPTNFRTKNWVEIHDHSRGTYNTSSQIKFKTSMLRWISCGYSDAFILVKGTILIAVQAGDNPNNANKKVVFKNCAPFTDCISKINNAQKDGTKHTDMIIPMYNLIEYGNNYSKISGNLWQDYRDEPALLVLLLIFMLLITGLWLNLNKK